MYGTGAPTGVVAVVVVVASVVVVAAVVVAAVEVVSVVESVEVVTAVDAVSVVDVVIVVSELVAPTAAAARTPKTKRTASPTADFVHLVRPLRPAATVSPRIAAAVSIRHPHATCRPPVVALLSLKRGAKPHTDRRSRRSGRKVQSGKMPLRRPNPRMSLSPCRKTCPPDCRRPPRAARSGRRCECSEQIAEAGFARRRSDALGSL